MHTEKKLSTGNKVTIAVVAFLIAVPLAWAASTGIALRTGTGTNAYTEAMGTAAGHALTMTGGVTSSVSTEVLVLSVAADGGVSTGTPVPASPLSGRKAIEICNAGPNTISCHADGTTVVAGKGREIAADSCWSLDCDGTACPVRCIAATADQATGNATNVTEIK